MLPRTRPTRETGGSCRPPPKHPERIAKRLQRLCGDNHRLLAFTTAKGCQRLDLFQGDLVLRGFQPVGLYRGGHDLRGIGLGIGLNPARLGRLFGGIEIGVGGEFHGAALSLCLGHRRPAFAFRVQLLQHGVPGCLIKVHIQDLGPRHLYAPGIHRILAVHTREDAQIVFVDTPGLHRKAGKAMNRLMNRAAVNALQDADLVLFITEAGRWTPEDGDVLRRLQTCTAPVIALLNKTDLVEPKERLLAELSTMAARYDFAEVMPISARKRDNLDKLLTLIPAFLPASPYLFPEDMRTDRGIEFQVAEIIREKLTLALQQEIPYGLTVQVERYDSAEDRITIHAVVWVERESQKGIVVGKGGRVLKHVGKNARIELRDMLGRPVHLELWVKVKDNWADSEKELLRLGYDTP